MSEILEVLYEIIDHDPPPSSHPLYDFCTIADCVPLKAAKQSQPIAPSKPMYEQNNRPPTTQSEGQDKGLKQKMSGILMKSWKSLSRKGGASFRSDSSIKSKASKVGGAVKNSSFKISGIRLPGLNRLLSLGRKSRKTTGDDQSQASQKSFDPHIFSEDETLLTVRPEPPAPPSLKPLQPSLEPSPLRLPSPARRSPTPSPARRSPTSSPEASFKDHTPPEIAILQTTLTDVPPVSPQHSPRAKPDSPPRSQSTPSSASTSTSSTPTASPRSESRVSPQPPRIPPFPLEPPSPDPTPTPPRPKSPSPSPRSGSKTPPPSPSPRSGSKTPPPSPSPRSGSKPPPPSRSLPSSTLKPQFPDRVQAPPTAMPTWRAMPPTKAAPPWRATSGTWKPPLPIPPTTGARSSMPTEPAPQRYQPPRRSRTPNWREELGGNCETTFAKDGEVPYWYRKHE
ncbi:unnamed protein product [Bemisia tabaci]|uniref:Uncharacterized protein n=1 Tax=Bemisia tabaci TaxID=7038 RepID=A0A9P0F587_BEMTA|nr:unnamed protein product [Bemisia tabaci]